LEINGILHNGGRVGRIKDGLNIGGSCNNSLKKIEEKYGGKIDSGRDDYSF
jgi:hypothetical protein